MAPRVPDEFEQSGRGTLMDALRRAYLQALLAGDAATAELTVREAIEAGLTQAAIDEQVIAPAMHAVGRRWATGELSIADERLATEISFRVLALQREAFRSAQLRSAHRVLLAAPEGEHHVMGLSMAADLLLHAGYDVRLLGPDVPIAGLAPAVIRHRPDVVGLTCTMPEQDARLLRAIAVVRRARPDVGIVVGGAGVSPTLRERHDLVICRHVSDTVEIVDALTRRAALN